MYVKCTVLTNLFTSWGLFWIWAKAHRRSLASGEHFPCIIVMHLQLSSPLPARATPYCYLPHYNSTQTILLRRLTLTHFKTQAQISHEEETWDSRSLACIFYDSIPSSSPPAPASWRPVTLSYPQPGQTYTSPSPDFCTWASLCLVWSSTSEGSLLQTILLGPASCWECPRPGLGL